MAVQPDAAASLAKATREIFDDAEALLLRRLAKTLAAGGESPAWAEEKLLTVQTVLRQVDRILADLAVGVPGAVERAVAMAYNRGSAAAAGSLSDAGLTAGAFDSIPPSSAVSAIVTDTVGRLEPMQFQIRRAVKDIYQQTVAQTAAQVSTGVLTRREASRLTLTKLAGNGVTGFRDVSGRQWEMASYAEQAVRTSAMNASLQGSTDRLRSLGQNLVIVSNAPEECKLCRPFEGKVLSLDGDQVGERLKDGKTVVASLDEAKREGLYHNNCRHSHSIYLVGITKARNDTADPAGNALRVQQRAYERRIRELKRRKAIDDEFGGPAAAETRRKLRTKQQEFAGWREANDRKNLSYRTSLNAR